MLIPLHRSEWAVNMHRDAMASHLGHPDQLMYFAAAEGVPVERVRLSMLERMVEPCGPKPRKLRGTREEEVVEGGLQKQLEDAAAKAEQAAGGESLKPVLPGGGRAKAGDGSEHDEYDMDDSAAGRAGDGEDESEDPAHPRRSGPTKGIRFVAAGAAASSGAGAFA